MQIGPGVELALPTRRAALDDQAPLGRLRPVVGRHGVARRAAGRSHGSPRADLESAHGCSLPRMTAPMHDSHPPEPHGGGHLAIGDLGLAGLVAKLAGRLDQQEDAAHARVAGRQAPAVGVEREIAAPAQVALGHVGPALPTPADPEALEQEQDGDGEGVVELHGVDVGRRSDRPGPGRRGRRWRPPVVGEVRHLADVPVGLGAGRAEHVDRRLLAGPGLARPWSG